MAKFKVCVQQYVEEIATVTIEAETAEEAVSSARHLLRNADIDGWQPGDDVMNQDVYAVLDPAGNSVWER